ncbi:UDP-N-acetyl-D-mannosamine dehydrogenase [Taibaiella koreensis]|uniref:UDP-N-acetyl-D-mannosamine dehydrogenase n=1 Tax=Taibaiella koreensis TaxID=1268548 RepID=UPI000E59CC03|nr:UDP-N-acetyl-D-mannosamine dehydrogenase [Taibaiella koreensis]
MNTSPKFEHICVVGLGYIGLPTAALLANRGFQVHGMDVVPHVVETINSGAIHIVEPELDTFVAAAVNSGKLKASTQAAPADVFILAVPTPFHEGYRPNIDYVIQATRSIAPFVKEGNLVILESTSPVGTTDKVAETLAAEGIDTSKIFIAHCPERVLPGHVMQELIANDRIVGGVTPRATEVAVAFYRKFVSGEVLPTDAKTAELCKLVENSYRDVNIAFANELSMICETAGINVWDLITLANRHPRVNILKPGPGVGGHCIAVDPWFIVSAYPEQARIIKAAREINDYKTEWVIERIKNEASSFELAIKRKPVIACLGLAFKPNIDDLRESPALEIYKALKQTEFKILPIEPNISSMDNDELYTKEHAIEHADILCFLVAHKEFNNLLNGKNLSLKTVLNFTGV